MRGRTDRRRGKPIDCPIMGGHGPWATWGSSGHPQWCEDVVRVTAPLARNDNSSDLQPLHIGEP
jgi:hypothetical protein